MIDVLATGTGGTTSFGDMGIRFDGFINTDGGALADIDIVGNTINAGPGQEDRGISFWNGVGGDSFVHIRDNDIAAGDDGIGVFDVEAFDLGDGAGQFESLRGNATMLITGNQIGTDGARVGLANGTDGNGIDFQAVTDAAHVVIDDNDIFANRNAIEFDRLVDTSFAGPNAGIEITNNSNIDSLNENGIDFAGGVTGSSVLIADNNNSIFAGANGIRFGDQVSGASISILDNIIQAGLLGNTDGDGVQFAGGIVNGSVVLITGNTVDAARNGLAFLGAVAEDSQVDVEENDISGEADGILFGGPVVDDAVVTIIANIVNGGRDGIDFNGIGENASVTMTGNTITFGSAPANALDGPLDPEDWDAGIRLTNVTSTVPVQINGGSINGRVDGDVHLGEIGVLIDNSETPPTVGSDNGGGNGTVLIDGTLIDQFSVAGVYVETSIDVDGGDPEGSFSDGNGIVLGLNNGVVISSTAVNAVGLWINGPETFLFDPALPDRPADFTLNDTTFDLTFSPDLPDPDATGLDRAAGNYIYFENFALWNFDGVDGPAPFVVDATDVTWTQTVDGVTTTIDSGPDELFSLAEIATLNARIRDNADGFDVGLIFLAPEPEAELFLPFLPFFDILGFGVDPTTPGDATFRSGELVALLPDIFDLGYGLGQFADGTGTDGGLGGLEPAAGGDTEGEGVGELEPAAGSGAGEDACVEVFFGDFWNAAAACETAPGDQTAALP